MLNKRIETALNEQIGEEAYSSNLYLAMASWCEIKGLSGCSAFFYRHAEEERSHMMKIFKYVNEMDGHAIVAQTEAPPSEYESIQKIFESTYEHERMITGNINAILKLCEDAKDYATHSFMQWFVDEQREEEATFKTILDKIKLIGDGPQNLYFIDREVEVINKTIGVE